MRRTPARRPRSAVSASSLEFSVPGFRTVHALAPAFLFASRGRFDRLRALGPMATIAKLRTRLWSRRELRVYRGDRALAARLDLDPRVERNRVSDLERFEPTEPWQSRRRFLEEAKARLARGEFVFTIRIGETLAHHGWMVQAQRWSYSTEVDQSIPLPRGGVALYDYYTHVRYRRRGLYRATLGHMMRRAFDDQDVSWAYISTLADNHPSRHVIESLGFSYQGSLFWQRQLFRVRRWSDARLGARLGRVALRLHARKPHREDQ